MLWLWGLGSFAGTTFRPFGGKRSTEFHTTHKRMHTNPVENAINFPYSPFLVTTPSDFARSRLTFPSELALLSTFFLHRHLTFHFRQKIFTLFREGPPELGTAGHFPNPTKSGGRREMGVHFIPGNFSPAQKFHRTFPTFRQSLFLFPVSKVGFSYSL